MEGNTRRIGHMSAHTCGDEDGLWRHTFFLLGYKDELGYYIDID